MFRTLKRFSTLPLLFALALPLLGCSGEEDEGDEGKFVYVVRQHTVVNGDQVEIDVAGGMGQVMDYRRYVPGARIEVYDAATGKIENLLEDARFARADVSSLDLSFDATRVVFTMKRDRDDSYHVYWAALERGEGGRFEIHQLTFGPQDDEHAIWLAGERIAFVTNQGYTAMGTRADEYNHARIVTQIATITLTGGDADRKLCSQNLSHTINLFPMADGRVGFSRWEHLENVNDVKLFAMNPDCTQMVAVGGQHGKPGNSIVQVQETATPNVFVGIVTERENTIQAGALVKIDARNQSDPTRFDEENPDFQVLTPSVPRDEAPSPVGRYRSPSVMPDGRVLVSWAEGIVNELNELSLTPPDYGLYVYNAEERTNELVVNHEKSWELYGRRIAKRAEPPIIAPIQNTPDATRAAVLGSVDIKQTSLHSLHGNTVSGAQFDGTPMDQALARTEKVRIIEGFSSEAAPGVTMFGLTMAEGAAILGEAKVEADGSWLAEIPPYLPVHLQPIDEFELAIRNQTTWIQGMPGESRVCGGCHENRSQPVLPGGQAITTAAARGAEVFTHTVGERIEYPWYYANDATNPNQVQSLFDAKCVSCHNETTNGNGPQEYYELVMNNELTGESTTYRVPRLDLSSREITVHYDRRTQPWPASYVSLFYPAAMEMEMGMGSTVNGTIPPAWAVPSDARNSVLIEKLNMTSSRDANRTAWPLGEAFSVEGVKGGTRTMHPEDVGVELTREERTMLIRLIDMGGQFYSRQNSDFSPYANDPVGGTGQEY